jgi:protein gp37
VADRSTIEWTQATWNPTTGCDRISDGCDHCYALTLAARWKAAGQPKYQTDGDPRTSGPGFGLAVHPDTLDLPRRWRAGRLVFVNSMSDLFHARVPTGFIRAVFDVMADTPQHTYQVLTKRSRRLARLAGELPWPPNVWMGVSVEHGAVAGRVDDLCRVPAAVRWVSAEPLIGPLDLTRWLLPAGRLCGPARLTPADLRAVREFATELTGWRGVDWVVVGGESGPGARPMDEAWARTVVRQGQAVGVPVFVKQLGTVWARRRGVRGKADDPADWPIDLRARQYPAGRPAAL